MINSLNNYPVQTHYQRQRQRQFMINQKVYRYQLKLVKSPKQHSNISSELIFIKCDEAAHLLSEKQNQISRLEIWFASHLQLWSVNVTLVLSHVTLADCNTACEGRFRKYHSALDIPKNCVIILGDTTCQKRSKIWITADLQLQMNWGAW